MRLLASLALVLVLAASCRGDEGDDDNAFALTPVPQFEDPFGRPVSCDGDRAFIADEVLVVVSADDVKGVVRRIESVDFTVRARDEAPMNSVWLTVEVPGGWVPAAVALMESWDGVLDATANHVTYSGDVLVDAPRQCGGAGWATRTRGSVGS